MAKRLPRELLYRINQLANQRTHGIQPMPTYRRAYRLEKAKLMVKVVLLIAAGQSDEQIIESLRDRRREQFEAARKRLLTQK
jgi:hypothetical protein